LNIVTVNDWQEISCAVSYQMTFDDLGSWLV